MYSKPTVINSITHRYLQVAPVSSYAFAADFNSCLVLGQEFLEAAKYYPVIFASNKDVVNPLAMLGARGNAFCTSEGKWTEGAYIPAFIRRYPYILAEGLAQDGALTVCIDADYPGYDAKDGGRLFTDEGENAPALNRAVEFLRLYHAQFDATKLFVNTLKDLNLFKPVDANVTRPDGANFSVKNFLMVDEQAVLNLPDSDLLSLVRRGYLAWIYAHLYSLTNFPKVINQPA